MCSWDSRFHGIFRDLGECPCLVLGFYASTGRFVIYFVFDLICIHILYWTVPLYLYVAECPRLHMYYACDEYLY